MSIIYFIVLLHCVSKNDIKDSRIFIYCSKFDWNQMQMIYIDASIIYLNFKSHLCEFYDSKGAYLTKYSIRIYENYINIADTVDGRLEDGGLHLTLDHASDLNVFLVELDRVNLNLGFLREKYLDELINIHGYYFYMTKFNDTIELAQVVEIKEDRRVVLKRIFAESSDVEVQLD